MLGVIGLFLGDLDSGVAVILVNYAFLFLVATAFIGMSARSLGILALVWALVAPVISFWLRLRDSRDVVRCPGVRRPG